MDMDMDMDVDVDMDMDMDTNMDMDVDVDVRVDMDVGVGARPLNRWAGSRGTHTLGPCPKAETLGALWCQCRVAPVLVKCSFRTRAPPPALPDL